MHLACHRPGIPDDGDIELPQLHRLPPAASAYSPDPGGASEASGLGPQAMADQHPVDGRPGRQRAHTLAFPSSNNSRRGPHPAVRPAHPADQRLQLRRDLPRMLRAPYDCGLPGPAGPRPGSGASQACTLWRLTPYRSATSVTGTPAMHFQHGPVSLLGHAQLPQHERECQASSGAHVSSIKRDSTFCGELLVSTFRICTTSAIRLPCHAGGDAD